MSNDNKAIRTVVHIGKGRLKHVDLMCIGVSGELKQLVRPTHFFQFMYDTYQKEAWPRFLAECKKAGGIPPTTAYEDEKKRT